MNETCVGPYAGKSEKPCSRCREVKPMASFAFYKSWAGRPSAYCKPCMSLNAKDWEARNKGRKHELKRRWILRNKYGIDQSQFEAMWAAQGGKCDVCATKLSTTEQWGYAIDHCHATGCIRGLLCHACNLGLGHFEDDPDRLISAAAYLRKHQTRKAA